MFRYEWIWHKNLGTGFLNAKKMPLKCHENILVFYQKLPTYNPQWTYGKPYGLRERKSFSENYAGQEYTFINNDDGRRYPLDVLPKTMQPKDLHPTQKPVDLLEYLIKTYTNGGELVLDATIGSGSTAVACVNTGRHFIGFETEEKFYEIANKRIAEAQAKKAQELL